MTQEEKQLLLKDLSARLPCGIEVFYDFQDFKEHFFGTSRLLSIDIDDFKAIVEYCPLDIDISFIKPYLRPMSSMTLEERKVYNNMQCVYGVTSISRHGEMTDWLNAHHFDYRGLISKGLAIEVTEENNPYEN